MGGQPHPVLLRGSPVTTDVSFIERRALDAKPGTAVPLSRAEVACLLADPAYRESLGEPARALHYRKSLPGGDGLHLVVLDGRGALHRDLHDPHRGLDGLGRHLTSESSGQAVSLLAAGLALLRRLGASPPSPGGDGSGGGGLAGEHRPGGDSGQGASGEATPG